MRTVGLLLAAFATSATLAGAKLTFDERTEIIRGLMAEFATAKVALPRAKKALEVTTAGGLDK